ncbi:ABC transporter permease subunit [Planococcus beigongshangi]|uniref:ABC transporter permease subunit n=1 Tax=Planococcus beigongshangi TaxID=2782536 RepID=UPI00193BB52F|nr:ABC transporter permease subunit [Planococcus beigongshangi]
MTAILNVFMRFFFVAIGLILLSAVVGLFVNGIHPDAGLFITQIFHIVKSLAIPENLTFTAINGAEYSIFPHFWEYYFYSLIIFLSSLILSLAMGIVLAYITSLLPEKKIHSVAKTVSLLEALPDLFIIMIIQFGVLVYYKQTGTLLFSIVSLGDNKTYIFPIIALALIPSIMVYKVILFLVKEEMKKTYVNFAKSTGFSQTYIFFHHILRNITPTIVSHSKSILLLLLSSMVIFEQIINIRGIFTFIIENPVPNVIAFTLILFYLPIFLIYALITAWVEKATAQRLEW